MKPFYLELILAITFEIYSAIGLAQAGEIDITFGTNGIVTTDFSTDDIINEIAIQPDGKIVAVGSALLGSYEFALARYNTNGALDNSFASDGKVNVSAGYSSWGNSVAIQSDGKIVAGGTSDNGTNNLALIRLNADGTIDNSFDSDGKVTTQISSYWADINSVVIQPDGRIVVAGGDYDPYIGNYEDFVLARYNNSGTLDSSFNEDGIVKTFLGDGGIAMSIAIQDDGKIIAGGYATVGLNYDFALVRYLPNGTPDSSFGSGGKVTTDVYGMDNYGLSVALQPDGKIVVGGTSAASVTYFTLVRYAIDGSLDTTFSHDGIATTFGTELDGGAHSIMILSDGKIVAAGFSKNGMGGEFALVRYKANGLLDSIFSDDGIVTTTIGLRSIATSLAIQSDGNIVAAGQTTKTGNVDSDFAIARYLSDLNIGISDLFSGQVLCYPNPIQETENFKYTLTKDEVLSLRLCDVKGSLIKTFFNNETRTSGEHTEELNFRNLVAGNYLLTLSNGAQRVSVKIVKQ